MDTPAQKLAAAAAGGAGTLIGVGLLAGLPALVRNRTLKLELRRSQRFAVWVAAAGAAAGATGHHLFVHVLHGSLERRAVHVGWTVGLGTSLAVWGVTYLGKRALSPFAPGPAADRVLREALPIAAISGPAVGLLVSRSVAGRLRNRFGG